jgi:hypothetical protein
MNRIISEIESTPQQWRRDERVRSDTAVSTEFAIAGGGSGSRGNAQRAGTHRLHEEWIQRAHRRVAPAEASPFSC